MKKVKIIHYTKKTGVEGIAITEDFKSDTRDFVPPNAEIESSFTVEGEFPVTFPFEYIFERV